MVQGLLLRALKFGVRGCRGQAGKDARRLTFPSIPLVVHSETTDAF